MAKTAFLCTQCGQPMEAKNPLAYKLLMAGKQALCDNCRLKNGRVWSPSQYQEYLKSDHWQMKRERKLQQSGRKCQICGQNGRLHVHHNTYERLGQELDSDLLVVCEKHHKMIHNKE